jgi:PAS domain S-box-containing protein
MLYTTIFKLRTFKFALSAAIFLSVLSCEEKAVPKNEQPVYESFREIPGITASEIEAIEAIKERHESFIYGVNHTSEAFPVHSGEDGEVGGYSALLCKWLTDMFGIRFNPAIYEWGDLLSGLENGEVDFTGDLTLVKERKETHFMTGAIAERSMSSFRMAGSPSIAEIVKLRQPRLAVPHGFAPFEYLKETVEYNFEHVFVSSYSDAYRMLKSGEVDAFLTMNIAEPALNAYGNVVSETFYPLVFASASISTRKPSLEPVISVVQKALDNGGTPYLARLYSHGHRNYVKNKFHERLTEKEFEYIQRNPTVKIATETDSYPLSFYNHNENEYQGIAFDVLRELKLITGISFEVANSANTVFSDLIGMAETGEASMITAMMRSKEREGRFLLPGTPLMKEHPVLISKSEFPNAQFHELSNVAVGLVKGTVHAELFKRWFPNNANFKEYDNLDDVFNALKNGNLDMFMSMSNYLLSIENYKEFAGFKTNVVFDNNFEITFGFNKDEDILCSIVDKALALVDLETISGQWTRKRYDYRAKMAEARLPWLIGATAMSLVTLALILFMFYRNRNEGKRLAVLVSEKNSTLTAILDSTPDLIFCKDLDLRYTEINKAMEIHSNRHRADIIGKNDVEAMWIPPDLMADYIAVDNKIIKEKKAATVEEYIQSHDGEKPLFETIKTPLIQNGKVTGLVGMSRNITQRKEMEQLAKQQAEAEAANRAKSSFLASMSHEIRTPMNAILGITEIQLQNEELPAETKNALNIIYNSGYTLLGIINDLLDLSKIEAGKLELINSLYETASLINDTVNLNTVRIGSKPIEFKLQVDENLPIEIIGDELRVKQILNNLLSNAFKYTDKGEIRLSFSALIVSDENVPYVRLTIIVSDTGQGMTEEQVQSLFDAYTRFNMKANRFVEGTGLGMNIVQHLVSEMDGDISVDSTPNKGTEVTVHLIQGYAGSATLGHEMAESLMSFRLLSMSKIKKAQIAREYMPYGKALVVDDMETNLYVARGFLLPYGLTIDTVQSGKEAIEKIESGKVYDIIFMDHMMPVMDGIETVKAIRAKGYAHPIVVLTANAVAGQEDIFMANGFDGFISKPIDVRELNASLNKFIRDRHPPEVVKAVRAAYGSSAIAEGIPRMDPELAKIFTRDAKKSADILQSYENRKSYENDDLQSFIINVHALKSALANIGEAKLSDFARELEQAGKDRNIIFISNKTPAFLNELGAVVDKLSACKAEPVAGEVSSEDMEHLRKTLQAIKGYCAEYDINSATAALKELKLKSWPAPYDEILDNIAMHLLRSNFDDAQAICEARLSDMEKSKQ